MGGFDAFSKLATASGAARASISKKWEGTAQSLRERLDPRLAEQIRQRNMFLGLISTKITGDSKSEMAPLQYHAKTNHKAVFLVTIPISFGKFELSELSYSLLAKHVGMSLDSVSHWAICVISRGFDADYCYDLMSDRVEFHALGKNYFRVAEITPEFVQTWSSCFYIGETTKSHSEIQQAGMEHMNMNPNYRLLSNNCQHLVDSLVKALCDGKVITRAKLDEELSLISPKIARDLIVARWKSKSELKEKKKREKKQHLEVCDANSDAISQTSKDDKEDLEQTIKEYVDNIKKFWGDTKSEYRRSNVDVSRY